MDSKEKIIKDFVDKNPEVVKEAYKDLIQPPAKVLGKGLETVAKTVTMALAPLKGLVWGYEQIESYLTERLATKLKDIPEEKIQTPPPNVVVPAIESIRYAGYDELRELYASLIASSMNQEKCNLVHPAYVEILRQMTPHEAYLLKKINSENTRVMMSFNFDKLGFSKFKDTILCLLLNDTIDPKTYKKFKPEDYETIEINLTSLDNMKRLNLFEESSYLQYKFPEGWENIIRFKNLMEIKKKYENLIFTRSINSVNKAPKITLEPIIFRKRIITTNLACNLKKVLDIY